MTEEIRNEQVQRYGYIGYTQDFPLDKSKYSLQADLLLKLARESVRKKDFYNAIRYLNTILMKNPNHPGAIYYKKMVMEFLNQLKKTRNRKIIALR